MATNTCTETISFSALCDVEPFSTMICELIDILKVYFLNADSNVPEALDAFRRSNVLYNQIQSELFLKRFRCAVNVFVECSKIACDEVSSKFFVCARCDESFLNSHNCTGEKTIVPSFSNTTISRNNRLSRRNAIYSSKGLHQLLLQRALSGDMIAFELFLNLKFSSWVKDLTAEGIEPNPGPVSLGDICSFMCACTLLAASMVVIFYFSFGGSQLWKRDLTMEGIEPNPGPVYVELTQGEEYLRFCLDPNSYEIVTDMVLVGSSVKESGEHPLWSFICGVKGVLDLERVDYVSSILHASALFAHTQDYSLNISGMTPVLTYRYRVYAASFPDDWYKPKWTTQTKDIGLVQRVSLGWFRDLTLEGVESNPGPANTYFFMCYIISMFCLCATLTRMEQARLLNYLAVNLMIISFVDLFKFIKDLTEEGIEPNPGPPVYSKPLKMLAKSEQRSKRMERLEKIRLKSKDLKIKEMRDIKYRPEALVEMSLDTASRTFLTNLIEELGKIFSNGTKVSFDLGIVSAIKELFDSASKAGTFFYDLLRFIFSFMCEFLDERVRELIKFVGDLLPAFRPESFYSDVISFWYFKDTLGKHISEGDFKLFVSSFKGMRDTAKNSDSVFDFILEFIRKLFDYLSVYFDVSLPSILNTGNRDIDSLYERFRKLRVEFREGVVSDYAFADKVYWLQNDVEGLIGKYSKDPIVKDKLTYLLSAFKPLVDFCERSSNVNNGPRVEPGTLLIGGPTGVGKSTLTMPLLLAVLVQILPKEVLDEFMKNHNDFVFFRANENEFWDGYKIRNAAIVYDDFGQMRDSAGNPNADAFESIRLINTAPYHLHFSAIGEKQKNFAHPKLVMATTNRPKLDFQSVVCPEAIVRRYRNSFVQVPKLEFCVEPDDMGNPWSRRLDMEKVRKVYPLVDSEPETFIVSDVGEFVAWDFAKGCYPEKQETLTFEQLVARVVEQTRDLHLRGDRMIEYHQFIKRKYRPEMNDEQFYDAYSSFPEVKMLSFRETANIFLDNACNVLLESIGYTISRVKSCFDKVTFLKLAAFMGSITLMLGAYRTLSSLFITKPESGRGSRNKMVVKTKKNKPLIRQQVRMMMPVHAPESGDQQAYDFLSSVMKRNVYTMYLNDVLVGNIVFIKGTTFVCPAHYDYQIMQSIEYDEEENPLPIIISCRQPGVQVDAFKFDWLRMKFILCNKHFDGMDLMMVKLGDLITRAHRDISEFFPTTSQMTRGNRFRTYMPVIRSGSVVVFTPDVHIYDDVSYQWMDEEFKSRALHYIVPSVGGDCGSPLVCAEGRLGRPMILGIHTAGDTSGNIFGFSSDKRCAGVMLTADLIKQLLDSLDEDTIFTEELSCEQADFNVEGFHGLREGQQPRKPVKTNIIPSPFQGKLWDVKTKPANLKPFYKDGVLIDPETKAMNKYLHSEPYVDQDILDTVLPFIGKMILKNNVTRPWNPKVFSFEEAVGGIQGVDFCDAIVRSTSAGYPFCLDPENKGKKRWLGESGDIDFSSPGALELKEMIEADLESAKKGIRKEYIFVDYLKDERRPIAKVNEGKTRQFMACPLPLLILCKMYFGDFIRHVNSNRIFNGVAVGMDPYTEWGILAKYLNSDGSYVFTAGDYSSYDGKIPVQVSLRVLEIIDAYYSNSTEEDRRVRKVLFQNIINSLHISKGIVYEFYGGNPSGQPMTADFNSIVGLILVYACAESMRRKFKDTDVTTEDLFANSKIITFGDDNVIGYRETVARYFEQANLTAEMKSLFNMDYTNESKDSRVLSGRSLSEVSFLKRGFRYESGTWDCPLELDVILETLNWQKKSSNHDEMELRVEGVLRELSLHGKAVFDKYAPTVCKVSSEILFYSPVGSSYDRARKGGFGLSFLN